MLLKDILHARILFLVTRKSSKSEAQNIFLKVFFSASSLSDFITNGPVEALRTNQTCNQITKEGKCESFFFNSVLYISKYLSMLIRIVQVQSFNHCRNRWLVRKTWYYSRCWFSVEIIPMVSLIYKFGNHDR